MYNDDFWCGAFEQIENFPLCGYGTGDTHRSRAAYEGKLPVDFPHVPSTAQDVIAQKQTEIDTINGAVSKLGKI